MNAQTFIDALRALEEHADFSPMLALFSEESETSNPTADKTFHGREGADRFWRAYRAAFDEVRSEFHTVVEQDGQAILEWTSRGRSAHGTDFEYDGVSVVSFPDGTIRRFRAYFDPAALAPAMTGQMETTSRRSSAATASRGSGAGAASSSP